MNRRGPAVAKTYHKSADRSWNRLLASSGERNLDRGDIRMIDLPLALFGSGTIKSLSQRDGEIVNEQVTARAIFTSATDLKPKRLV